MKKLWLIVLSCCMLLGIASLTLLGGLAAATDATDTVFDEPHSVKDTVTVNRIEIKLYTTLDDPETAIKNAYKKAPNAMRLLADFYGLDTLSDDNWEAYAAGMFAIFDEPDCPDWYTESNDEFMYLGKFFDLYENKFQNEEIQKYVENHASSDLSRDFAFLVMLPFNSPFYIENIDAARAASK